MLRGMKLIEEYVRLEAKFARHFYNGDMPDRIRQHKGKGGVLLAAPHSSNRMVGGRPRQADRYTGALAQILAIRSGHSWLAADGVISEWAAWESRHDRFRDALDAALDNGRFVIDLRAAPADARGDIFIGLGPRPSEAAMTLAERIDDAFPEFKVVVGGCGNTAACETLSSYARGRGGDGIQLNLSSPLRDPIEFPDSVATFIKTFAGILGSETGIQGSKKTGA